MPSGPGALYGFSFLSCAPICSVVILPSCSQALGYSRSARASSEGGFVGKKFLASTRPLSQLALASSTVSPALYLSTGILVFPPSPPAEEVRRCAAQMSGSSAFSSQSRQWCLLVWSNMLWYFLTIAACSLCMAWSTSRCNRYDCLPSLFAARRSCVSSFVHHRLDFDVMFDIGTF